jgi:hypothetical protein
MLIGYPMLRIQIPQVDMSSHLVEQLYHENPSNKCLLLDSRWNYSLFFFYIKLERKPNGFKISYRIFHVGQYQCQIFVSIVIVNWQLEKHKVAYIMVSLDIYVIDIISLNACSQIELFSLIM